MSVRFGLTVMTVANGVTLRVLGEGVARHDSADFAPDAEEDRNHHQNERVAPDLARQFRVGRRVNVLRHAKSPENEGHVPCRVHE